jgi:mRNA turnover protein 4
MPKSKRNKVIPLTKTKKTIDKDRKVDLVDKVHNYLDEFSYVYVFRYKNMTNLPMQELRNYWNDSKFVIGKNKVLQIALGKSEDTSYKTNSYLVSPVSISF